ncbi:CDK5RAP3-like protein isoform X2 [Toxorhynchites rutilus septentrionalis]|uniref:CDK5RAP3-like protein isoform X2 n=1 Tax=Toxorhynchites rutilus septentrionalis TaxID=329112 RepID=UPI0024790934|nr:CDK5RAP3-like protein isoform X2 [Toxorhynchites rutilus septentrionalis]
MNEADIPIDIHAGKLQDWLVSRRIVNKNWHQSIRDVRSKISNALTDMPAHEGLVQLLKGAHINYFHCKQIIDILKTTEADSKNVFGRYGSQRMKDWQEILKVYEKESLYLAEAAQILVRNINYEIPGIRKQIKHFEQLGDEAEKKIGELQRSETIIFAEYQTSCKQLGIAGENVRQELVTKVGELPQMFSEIAIAVPGLLKAVELYGSFSGNAACLPILRHVATAGNTTVYEFLYSEAPLSIVEPPVKFDVEESVATESGGIDFGDGDGNIDFGDAAIDYGAGDESEVNLEVGDIDWGAPEEPTPDDNEIDFNVSLDESGIVVESDGNAGGVARGDEAYSIFDSPSYREKFINELLELEAFLKMRLYEVSTADSVHILSLSMMDSLPDHDAKSLAQMISHIDAVYCNFNSQQIQHLHQIKHSPKYVDILTSKLKQKLAAVDKLKSTQQSLKEKAENFRQQGVSLKPTLANVIEQTKVLQGQIEEDISKRYKNRDVNLIGANL